MAKHLVQVTGLKQLTKRMSALRKTLPKEVQSGLDDTAGATLIFEQFMDAFELNFADPEKRARLIQDWFLTPFWKAYELVRDILKVFAGIDIQTALFGGETGMTVKNTCGERRSES
jgi:hypothetical protein